ncbi:MAG: vWA domain-containing protein [Pirellulales bacterium]
MAEEFVLDWKVDQPAIQAGHSESLYTLVTIRPNIAKLGALLESAVESTLPAHLIVVVDVSGLMQDLIQADPNARIVGRGSSEGKDVTIVETDVPSRLQVAERVVQRLADRLTQGDRMSLVAFDHQAHPLARSAIGSELQQAVRQLADTGGGGTSMGRGFQAVLKCLPVRDDGRTTCKIIVLTDGEDQEPDFALEQARVLAAERHVPIHAFGTGPCRVDFLTEVCKTTMGGEFRHIQDDREAEQYFDDVLTRQKNILATNVRLTLWLSPDIFVQELYRTKPEILYAGKIQPGADNTIAVPIEYMEKGKAYEFLFNCTVPARDAGRFRLAKAVLTYDIPALHVLQQKCEANVVVEFTTDAERALVRVGDVRRVIAQAEVQRQVLFLQGKIDALKSGHGTDKDKTVAGRLLDVLIKKHQEFNDQANANLYSKMRDEFLSSGIISQDMLNRSLAASSKVEETVAVQEIDDF